MVRISVYLRWVHLQKVNYYSGEIKPIYNHDNFLNNYSNSKVDIKFWKNHLKSV